jgi:hypothetical protein
MIRYDDEQLREDGRKELNKDKSLAYGGALSKAFRFRFRVQ